MVLVDFKGGATFAGMTDLPHVSAVITNLAQELTLVDRMQDALSGEMVRRQELLREAGNFASVRDYEKARVNGEPLEPLPSLFIVVDEFSEMLSAKPEFIDLFVAIGRLGRSLGLHLLLASQRLEEGRLRGLDSHLSYRVGLRTFSAGESRSVLGVPDAYELPPVPGLGFLKPDQSTLLRFKAAYVSGPPSGRSLVRRDEGGHVRGILPFTISEVQTLEPLSDGTDGPAPPPVVPAGEQESLLDVAVGRMTAHGPAAHQVWLPPLDVPDTLDRLLPDLTEDPALGLVSPTWRRHGGLVVAIRRQGRRSPHCLVYQQPANATPATTAPIRRPSMLSVDRVFTPLVHPLGVSRCMVPATMNRRHTYSCVRAPPGPPGLSPSGAPCGTGPVRFGAGAAGQEGGMNLEKVVFGFFVLLAATLNFGFFIGDLGDPELHNSYELYAAVVVNLIATVLKFGDRTQIGAVHLATSLVADLQLISAALVWGYASYVGDGLTRAATASVVSLSGGALLANIVSVVLLVVETVSFHRR